jgi:hypothetical protein
VFVDYNKNGKMTRMELLPLSAGATLTATSSPGVGKLVEENIKGAWVVGDARTNAAGSFSARVQLLTATADLYGACAYASSYPPVGQYVSESEIIFSGTPWYELKLLHEDGYTIETIESGSTFLLPCSYTVSSFTDATGAPGIIKCLAPANLMFATPYTTICAGATVTLTASATGAASYSIDGSSWQPEATFEVAPASNESYTLYAKTAEGCVTSVANAAVVTVNPTPTDLSLTATPAAICKDESATLTAYATNGYRYSRDNSAWQTTTAFNVTPTSTTAYTLYVRSTAGCTATLPNAATVTVGQPGAAGQAPDATCGCADGLTECSGTCTATACNFTACAGITEVVPGSGIPTFYVADATCKSKGANFRIPTYDEMKCMCMSPYKTSLFSTWGGYWTTTLWGTNVYYSYTVNSATCQTTLAGYYNPTSLLYFVCVR